MNAPAFAALSEYERNNLVIHLVEAGETDELDNLLNLDTSENQNAWFVYKDGYGDINKYLDEINLAVKASLNRPYSESYITADKIYRLLFYHLLKSSVINIARNIPPELLKGLVKHKVWSEDKALRYAFRIPDVREMSDAVVKLVPLLGIDLKEKIFHQVYELKDKPLMVSMLTSMSACLPDYLTCRIIDQFIKIESQYERLHALVNLAPVLNADMSELLMQKMLDGVLFTDDDCTQKLLRACSPFTPDHMVERMVFKIYELVNDYEAAEAFSLLRSKLPVRQLEDIIAGLIPSSGNLSSIRAEADLLVELVKKGGLKPGLKRILLISDQGTQFKALAAVVPYLAQHNMNHALRLTRKIKNSVCQSQAVVDLARLVTEDQLPKLLKIASGIWSKMEKATAFLALANRFSGMERSPLLDQAWLQISEGAPLHVPHKRLLLEGRSHPTIAFQIAYGWCTIAPDFARLGDAPKAIGLLKKSNRKRGSIDSKESAFLDEVVGNSILRTAPFLTTDLLPEAIDIAEELNDKAKGISYQGLAPYLSASHLETIFKEAKSVEVIQALAPHAPQAWFTYFFRHRLSLFIDDYRPDFINILSPFLASDMLPEALQITRLIKDEYGMARALAGLAQYVAQPLRDKILMEAYSQAEKLEKNDYGSKAAIYEKCALLFHPALLWKLLADTKEWYPLRKEETQKIILVALARKECYKKAFATAKQILGEQKFHDFIIETFDLLPAEQRLLTLLDAQEWGDRDKQELISSMRAISEEIHTTVISLASSIADPFLLKDAIVSLCAKIPGGLSEQLQVITESISLPMIRIQALSAIFDTYKNVPEKYLQEATEEIKAYKDIDDFNHELSAQSEEDRADALVSLGRLLTEKQLSNVVDDIVPLLDGQYLQEAIAGLAKYMSLETLQAATRQVEKPGNSFDANVKVAIAARLAELGYIDQAFNNVKMLQHIVYKLNFYQALSAALLSKNIIRALREIEYFDNQDDKLVSMALIELIPFIKTIEHLQIFISVLQKIKDKFTRSEALEKLIASIIDRDRSELDVIFQLLFITENRRERVHTFFDLHATAPLLHKLGGENCIKKIVDGLLKIISWWP